MSTAEQPADVLPTPIAPPLHMRYAVWWLLFLAGGIAASLLHDALWDDFVIAGYLGAGVMAVAIARWRAHRDSNGLAAWTFAVGRGLLLGVLLLGHGMLTWASADAVGRGEAGEPALWVIRIVLALFFGAVVLLFVRRPVRRGWNVARLTVLALLGAGFVVVVVLLAIYTGPTDLVAYPPMSESPYRLPWKPGIRRLCGQSNRGVVSHRGFEQYAYDFTMPVGAEVCAARGGLIVNVIDHNDGNGLTAPHNVIGIRHDDNTLAQYLHLRKNGARVKKGQRVAQGEVIGESGNVGYSTSPHLHFEVTRYIDKRWVTIPVTFADVPGDGIPRAWRRYTSGG